MTVPDAAAATERLRQADVPQAELAAIAATFPQLRAVVVAHPNADAGLRGSIAREVCDEVDGGQRRGSRAPRVVTGAAGVVVVGAVAALVVGLVGRPAQGGEDPVELGFATPEEAVTYVVDRLAAGDPAGASEAFATTHMVDGYSFETGVEHAGGISTLTLLPVEDFRALDVGMRQGEVARELRAYAWRLTEPDLDANLSTPLDEELTAAGLAATLDPRTMAGVSVVSVDVLFGENLPARALAYDRESAAVWGADAIRHTGVLLATPAGPMMGGAELLEYDGLWYVQDLRSSFLAVGTGELVPTTAPEYAASVAYLRSANGG